MFKFKKLFAKYTDLLETQPIKTKVLTQSSLFVLGDAICQKAVFQNEKLDYERLTYGSLASAGLGLLGHFYFKKMDAFIQSGKLICQKSSKLKKTLVNLSIDQSFYGPFTNSLFMVSFVIMMERSAQQAAQNWKEKFEKTQKASYCLWPAAQFVNYYLVPLQFRLLYMNVIGVGWTTVRSSLTADNLPEKSLYQKHIVDKNITFNGVVKDSLKTMRQVNKQIYINVYDKIKDDNFYGKYTERHGNSYMFQ